MNERLEVRSAVDPEQARLMLELLAVSRMEVDFSFLRKRAPLATPVGAISLQRVWSDDQNEMPDGAA